MQLRKIVALIVLWLTAGGLSGFAQKKPTTYTTPTRNSPVGGNTRNTPVGGNKAGMPSKLRLPPAAVSPYRRQQQAPRQPTPRQLRRLSKAEVGQGKAQQRASGSPRELKPVIPLAKSQPVILARAQAKPRLDRLRKQLMSSTALGSMTKLPTSRISIDQSVLQHVVDSHTPKGKLSKGKSIFADGTDIRGLVKAAENVPAVTQANGRQQRIVNAGRVVGNDYRTGKPTTMYTVITTRDGELVTIHPGLPEVLSLP